VPHQLRLAVSMFSKGGPRQRDGPGTGMLHGAGHACIVGMAWSLTTGTVETLACERSSPLPGRLHVGSRPFCENRSLSTCTFPQR